MTPLFKNFQHDLANAKKRPLLLDLKHKSLENFTQNKNAQLGEALTLLSAGHKYRSPKENETNVIFIDAKHTSDDVIIISNLLENLSPDLKEAMKLDLFKSVISGSVTFAINTYGGKVLDILSGGAFSNAIEEISDNVIESILGYATDYAENQIETLSESASDYLVEEVQSILDETVDVEELLSEQLDDKGQKLAEKLLNKIEDGLKHEIYLGKESRRQLLETYRSLEKNDVSLSDLFNTFIKTVLLTGLDQRKLFVIKNPHLLDPVSLAIIEKIFSYAKDARYGHKIPVSFLFLYPEEVDEKKLPEAAKKNYKHLERFLLYLRRYSMLEVPESDIPRMAVTSDIFVGREEEIGSLQERDKEFFTSIDPDKKTCYIDTIVGEPGMGKTRLYEAYLSQLQKKSEHNIVTLRIVNEIGGINSGLSSLISSIENEGERLRTELVNKHKFKGGIVKVLQTIKERSVDSFGDTLIESLGLPYEVKNSLASLKNIFEYERKQEETSEKIRSFEQLQQESSKREENFLRLVTAMNNLDTIVSYYTGKETLFQILLDDVQWIDEESCELLLNYFPERYNARIVVTARASDTVSSYVVSQHEKQKEKLFNMLSLIKTEGSSEQDPYFNIGKRLDLAGFDETLVTSLVNKVIVSDNEESKKALSQGILKFLTKNTDTQEATTLFVVETLNILCDEKFYGSDQTPLILEKENQFFINPNVEVEKSLIEIFERLEEKYKDSVTIDEETSGFNLASVAILEERLKLIEVHYGEEKGKSLVNGLLFTALIGDPFDFELIKSIVKAIVDSKEASLRPLAAKLHGFILHQNEVDSLEEIYQMIKRLVTFEYMYLYTHSLLQIFLRKKFEKLLDTSFTKNTKKDAIDRIVALSKEQLISDNPELFRKDSTLLKNREEYKLKIVLQKRLVNTIRYGYNNNQKLWLDDLIASLSGLATLFRQVNQADEAIRAGTETIELLRELFTDDPTRWVEKYTSSLYKLAEYHKSVNQINEAIPLGKESVQILNRFYGEHPDQYVESWTRANHNLASILFSAGQIEEAIKLGGETVGILRKLYKNDPNYWAKDFTMSLANQAGYFSTVNLLEESIELGHETVEILTKLYTSNPTYWAEIYTGSLYNLSNSLGLSGQKDKAISCGRKVMEIRKNLYDENPDRWVEPYAKSLNNLALSLSSTEQSDEAIKLGREVREILQKLYVDNPNKWGAEYARTLRILASSLKEQAQNDEAIILQREAQGIIEKLFSLNPKRWTGNYAIALYNLATSLNAVGQTDEAIILGEKAHEIFRELHAKRPDQWADILTLSQDNLATYKKESMQNRRGVRTKGAQKYKVKTGTVIVKNVSKIFQAILRVLKKD